MRNPWWQRLQDGFFNPSLMKKVKSEVPKTLLSFFTFFFKWCVLKYYQPNLWPVFGRLVDQAQGWILIYFFQFFQNFSKFQTCGIHFYQFNNNQSTSSLNLKFLLNWAHLFSSLLDSVIHSRLKCLGGVPVLWSKWPLASSLLQVIKTCRQACPPGYLCIFHKDESLKVWWVTIQNWQSY